MAVTLKERAVALVDTLPPTKVKKAIEYLEYLNEILTDNPLCGDAIPGLDGKVFKLRLASSDMGKGKSGSFRVIYYVLAPDKTIYLLTIYAKAYKENIDPIEIKALLKKNGLGN